MLTPAELAIAKGAKLYDWQAEALESFGNEWPTVLLTCNGAGKTAIVAARAVDWFFTAYPKGKLVATSGSFNQLQNQLWPSLKQHLTGARITNGTSPCTIVTREGGKGIGFSTNDPGRAEGFHPTESRDVDPVCILVDEAKTVPEGIFQAFDRCTKRFQLYLSSTGSPFGRFYECFHSNAAYYYKVRADWTRCPHIDPAKIERDLQTYGPDHPIYRSMHLAEFTEDAERLVLAPDRLTKALDGQPPEAPFGEVVAFCDFAAGRDENVLAIRRGNVARIKKAWVEKDTMQAAREFVHLCKADGLSASQVWGDADGLGTAMIDAMAELDFRINRFHGGTPSSEPDEYANLIAEVWHVGAREIERGRVNISDSNSLDPVTFKQLSTRKSEWNEAGKLRVESKDKMRAEGRHSPDRGDALLGCIVCGSRLSGAVSADSVLTGEPDRDGFSGGLVTGW